MHCLISFGSNLGDRDAVVAHAAQLVDRSGIVVPSRSDETPSHGSAPPGSGLRASRLFETPPIGGPGGQSPFLNAVAAFVTDASAADVLDVLQRVEQELGRKREYRWGARSIDLDVVLHGQLCGAAPAGRRGLIGGRGPVGSPRSLVVPHPRYTARKFVVVPACDVAADYRDPRFGWTLADLATHLAAASPSMALTGGDESLRRTVCERLASQYHLQIVDADARSAELASTPSIWDRTRPWVSPTVPQALREQLPGPENTPVTESLNLPRLIARIQRTTAGTRWPAPHQIWPSGWRWPEYRLEVDDLDWAVGEMASALESMCCDVRPITSDGSWWYS